MRFLDVGQGDATLIQHPDGAAVLFDGGPPEAGVARLLRRAGVRRLGAGGGHPRRRATITAACVEVLAASRSDLARRRGRRHHGPRLPARSREAARARRRAACRRCAPLTLRRGRRSTIRVLSPAAAPARAAARGPEPARRGGGGQRGGFDLLLSADAESPALAPLALPDVDAMKVPHHGSADPGLPEVLERLRPEVAAIEVGAEHLRAPGARPRSRRCAAPACRTYRTDRDGTVTLRVEGRLRVDNER